MDSELKEEDFIQDEFQQSPNPFLLSIFFLAIGTIVFTAIVSWYNQHQSEYRKTSPFYQVTNRDFALFLRENPRFLNENVSNKEAYLPGVKFIENIQSNVQEADQLIDAPDPLIFQYHTWNRLIDYPPFPRAIPVNEYKEFLNKYQEWIPLYWKGATKAYANLYKQIQNGTAPANLSTISKTDLPDDVREAFFGWKNFNLEKSQIETFRPTYELLKEFIEKYPNFQRNYWFNILKESDYAYLQTFSFEKYDPKATVPEPEISPFLQIALFNYLKSKEESQSPP